MEYEDKDIALLERVTDITTINPQWDDIIVVRVDVGNMPIKAASEYLAQSAKELKKMFPKNKLMVMSAKTSVILEKDTEE